MLEYFAEHLKASTATAAQHMYREQWLDHLTQLCREPFRSAGYPLPEKIRVSCGWPRGGRQRIGECWTSTASKDKAVEIFISPELDDPARVADVHIHELCHAATEGDGHGSEFRRIARMCGLEGKLTATIASDELRDALNKCIEQTLGPYPHRMLCDEPPTKKQGTRLVKLECDSCGMIIRTTQKWLDATGAPTCACGGSFEAPE